MDGATELQATEIKPELDEIATLVHTVAHQHQGKSLELLGLLRLLESLHQEIRDSLFQQSLPDNRQALYALLRDIELCGAGLIFTGMKLQAFLANLPIEPSDAEPQE